jgi:hypothetical protein
MILLPGPIHLNSCSDLRSHHLITHQACISINRICNYQLHLHYRRRPLLTLYTTSPVTSSINQHLLMVVGCNPGTGSPPLLVVHPPLPVGTLPGGYTWSAPLPRLRTGPTHCRPLKVGAQQSPMVSQRSTTNTATTSSC